MCLVLQMEVGTLNAAESFEIDGIYYRIKNNHAMVIKGSVEYSGNVVIPSYVNYKNKTYEVEEIAASAFKDCTMLTSISLPEVSMMEIGDDAFSGCDKLTSVTLNCVLPLELYKYFGTQVTTYILGEAWMNIGATKFTNCTSLQEIHLPSTIQSIGKRAFEGCVLLNKVVISDLTEWCKISFEDILSNPLYYAHHLFFNDNTEITSVTFPGNRFVNNFVFAGCESINNVIIPEGVWSIGKSSFEGCTNLVSIDIPKSLISISESAFKDCSSLSGQISIPEGQETIGKKTFAGCTSIEGIIIPESVVYIEDSAFTSCHNIYSFDIPKHVVEIGNSAFKNCTNLTSIELDCYITELEPYVFSGCNKLVNVILPSTIKKLGNYSFANCSSLSEYEIPSTVSYIGDYAFADCKNLKIITIPSGVTGIGEGAFYNCTGLNEIVSMIELPFPVSDITLQYNDDNGLHVLNTSLYVPSIKARSRYKETDGWNQLEKILFRIEGGFSAMTENGVEMIFKIISQEEKTCQVGTGEEPYQAIDIDTERSIHIPAQIDGYDVIGIGTGAFAFCEKIQIVKIPNSISNIGSAAFYGCTGLKVVASNIVNPFAIDEYAFQYDNEQHYEQQLKAVLVVPPGTRDAYLPLQGWNKLDNIVEGFVEKTAEGVEMAFAVTDIQNKKCIAGLGVMPNQNATSVLQNTAGEITIPTEINGYSVIRIAERAFARCEEITNIYMPSSIIGFDRAAFTGCKKLITMQMPDNLEIVGETAFYGCEALKELSLPNSVLNIERAAFSDCTNLVEISFPQSIKIINEAILRNCVSLKNITIPSQVTSIGNAAFYNCTSLSTITSLNPLPPSVHDRAFTSYDATLQVPHNSKSVYQNADVWKNFTNIKEVESTGINNINSSIEKEHHNNHIYDLSGKRIGHTQKGINIING